MLIICGADGQITADLKFTYKILMEVNCEFRKIQAAKAV